MKIYFQKYDNLFHIRNQKVIKTHIIAQMKNVPKSHKEYLVDPMNIYPLTTKMII